MQLFADFGILMLLFVVGMTLDLRSFKRTMGLSLKMAGIQILLGLSVAYGLHVFFALNLSLTLLIGFVLGLSSTAVAVKMLETSHDFNSDAGRLTLGVLIAQDLAIVPMILILRDIDGQVMWGALTFKILLALGILTLFVWFFSRPRKLPFLINFSAAQPELPALVGLSLCFGMATISGFIGLSVAYGSFFGRVDFGQYQGACCHAASHYADLQRVGHDIFYVGWAFCQSEFHLEAFLAYFVSFFWYFVL